MSFIEGIGDEVVYVIGMLVILIIFAFAWYSTSVGDHPIFRASVLVIERRRAAASDGNIQPRVVNVQLTAGDRVIATATSSPTISSDSVSNEPNTSQPTVEQVGQQIVDLVDQESTKNVENDNSPPSSSSEVADQVDDGETQLRNRFRTTEQTSETSAIQSDPQNVDSDVGNIRIRLVFLNDTQRLVEARLDDRLGQFKQQHFREELESRRVVRLIFNGQLLQSDQETLQFYGLSDNCVVHCHVSNITVSTPPPQQYSQHAELDLSRLMLPLFGLILGLIWCCRMQYRQYFNAASTFALIGITVLFVISVFSVCVTARNRLQARG